MDEKRVNLIPGKKVTGEKPRVTAILVGLAITIKNLLRNIFLGDKPTIQYPEEKREYSERFRGVHILNKRPDGSPKCVACFMCATVCPAECIYIEAGESPDNTIEKYPVRFEIDMLRCVFCGFCVDACPEEAIIMSKETECSFYSVSETVYKKEFLLNRPSLEKGELGYRPNINPNLRGKGGKFLPISYYNNSKKSKS